MFVAGILESIIGELSNKTILGESRTNTNPIQQLTTATTSSSSSSSTHQYCYDVFPSFSGKDVRRTFLSHFLEGLKSKGIKTFIDNGIMRSESINSELVKAIRESRISLVILSESYASSSWCLDELQLIMECRVSLGQTVMPIFYDVGPSDVRNQTGDFGRPLRKFVMERQRDVLNELPSSDFDRLVGIETHVERMKKMICLENDEVKMVGIWGPAGIGKTTIARALYQQVSCNFQLKFYMENHEGTYNRTTRDPARLQEHLEKEIYSGVLDHRGVKILDLQEVQFRLKHQRVLLILDDVCTRELQALGDLIQGLRYGSKVIVTNENLNTLRDNEIKQIYKVSFPSTEEAQQIFSYSAFGQSTPPRGYLKHAVEVAKLVSPFPLGLKVLGSALRGKSKEEWRTTPAKLKNYLSENDVEKAIRYVYDGLSEKHKYLFGSLRGSKRWGKNDVMFSLAGREWYVEEGIQTLADLALISICSEGGIIVHHVVGKLMWEMSTLVCL
ncbi:hypothetical protein Bca101_011645 [Brassica carinata]